MEYCNNNVYSLYYDSVLEWNKTEPTNNWNLNLKKSITDRNYGGLGWYGPTCRNASESIEKSINGDDDLYERYVKPRMEKLHCSEDFSDHVNITEIKKRKRIKSDFGNEVHMDRIYSGQFDRAWDNTIRESVREERKFYTLLINIGGLGDVSAIDSLWTAAAALKLYQIIISKGDNCEIMIGNVSNNCVNDQYPLSWAIPVKRFGEQLMVSRLCAMAYVGFYRSLGFMIKTHCSKPISERYGCSTSYNQNNIPQNLAEDVKRGETNLVIIEKSTSEQGALNSIEKAVQKLKKL